MVDYDNEVLATSPALTFIPMFRLAGSGGLEKAIGGMKIKLNTEWHSTAGQLQRIGRVALRDTTQSIPHDIPTKVTFSAVDYDIGGFFTGSDLIIPRTGMYLVTVELRFVPNSTGDRGVWLMLNDMEGGRYAESVVGATTVRHTVLAASTTTRFLKDTKLNLMALQSSGGNLNIERAVMSVSRFL